MTTRSGFTPCAPRCIGTALFLSPTRNIVACIAFLHALANSAIGEDEDDPVFFISDLLIHLSQEQMAKKTSEAVTGEALDLVVGNKPFIIDSGKNDEEDEDDYPYANPINHIDRSKL